MKIGGAWTDGNEVYYEVSDVVRKQDFMPKSRVMLIMAPRNINVYINNVNVFFLKQSLRKETLNLISLIQARILQLK